MPQYQLYMGPVDASIPAQQVLPHELRRCVGESSRMANTWRGPCCASSSQPSPNSLQRRLPGVRAPMHLQVVLALEGLPTGFAGEFTDTCGGWEVQFMEGLRAGPQQSSLAQHPDLPEGGNWQGLCCPLVADQCKT